MNSETATSKQQPANEPAAEILDEVRHAARDCNCVIDYKYLRPVVFRLITAAEQRGYERAMQTLAKQRDECETCYTNRVLRETDALAEAQEQ